MIIQEFFFCLPVEDDGGLVPLGECAAGRKDKVLHLLLRRSGEPGGGSAAPLYNAEQGLLNSN